jgi:hypothetical protein
MNTADRRRLAAMTNITEVHEYVRRVGARRAKPSAPEIPGKSREERRAAADALEDAGKAAARARSAGSTIAGVRRCEWHENGQRCGSVAAEVDHVLGGRWKKDMEELPAGEGFQDLCTPHHQITKHGPDKLGALAQAKEHAIRIRSRGLLRHVEDAIARYHARHPEAR